jgi:hypothetical protein
VQRVKNFAAFLGGSPGTATFEDVRRYQLHLAASGVGVPTINQTVSTLRFFFRVTLKRHETGTLLEQLEHAVRYKEKYAPIFEKHEREGLDPPDIYPHPDDVIINEATGEVTFDGPMTKEQAGARKAVRKEAIQSMRQYFEIEAALKKEPTNRELRREFKELKKYNDFLKQDAERTTRHEALRLSRLALRGQNHPNQKTTPRIKRDG